MKKVLFLIFASLLLFNISINGAEMLGTELVIESLSIDPFPVEPDSTFDLTVKIRNSNTRRTMPDLRFNIQESYPFSIEEKDKIKRIQTLNPNEQTFVTFRVKTDVNAIKGENELKINFQEGTGVTYVSNPIKVDVKGTAIDLSIVSITTNPSNIRPGDEVEATLTLKNTVPVLMKNIDINFDLSSSDNPFTPIRSTTKRSITSLNKGAEKKLTFNLAVDADAKPGVYKIPLKIDYEDEFGKEYGIDTLTGLKVSTIPVLQYTIDSSEIYSSGNNGKVAIKIVNSGLTDIKFLSVKLMEGEGYKIISVPEVYLGNLESDDYETAEYAIYVSSWKKELPLNLLVTYKDFFNEEYSVEKVVNLPLYSMFELSRYGLDKDGSKFAFIWYAAIIVFIYLFIKEWKKTRDVPIALKITVRHFLVFIKRAIKSLRIKNLKILIKNIVKFFSEP